MPYVDISELVDNEQPEDIEQLISDDSTPDADIESNVNDTSDRTPDDYNITNDENIGSGGEPIPEDSTPEAIEPQEPNIKKRLIRYGEYITDYSKASIDAYKELNAQVFAIYDDETEKEVSWDEVSEPDILAMQAVNEAATVAAATNQHFWDDDNGAHVTDDEQNAWKEAEADDFPDYDADEKPWYNILMNSLGILLRSAKKTLVQITHSVIAFYDGDGNNAENIIARFGRNGAQIGATSKVHTTITQEGFKIQGDPTSSEMQLGILNNAKTGAYPYQLDLSAFSLSQPSTDNKLYTDRVAYKVTTDYPISSIDHVVINISPYNFRSISSGKLSNGVQYSAQSNSSSRMYSLITQPQSTYASNVVPFTKFGEPAPDGTLFWAEDNNLYFSITESSNVPSNTSNVIGYIRNLYYYTEQIVSSAVIGHSSAIAPLSFAHGDDSLADKTGAFAANCSKAQEIFAFSENQAQALGAYSHAENNSTASQAWAHSEGFNTAANGYYSHAGGYGTIAAGDAQTVIGKNNIEDSEGIYAFIVGNGYYPLEGSRKNAFTVDWDGNIEAEGNVTANSFNGIDLLSLENKVNNTNLDKPSSTIDQSAWLSALGFTMYSTTNSTDVFESTTNTTINSMDYVQYGKVAMLRVYFTYAGSISVPASGNISNITIGTIRAGKRPKARTHMVGDGDNGGHAHGNLQTNGKLEIGSFDSRGSAYTIAANSKFSISLTYIVA